MKIRSLSSKKDNIVVDVRFVMTKAELNDLSSELADMSRPASAHYLPTIARICESVANAAHGNLPEWSEEDEMRSGGW